MKIPLFFIFALLGAPLAAQESSRRDNPTRPLRARYVPQPTPQTVIPPGARPPVRGRQTADEALSENITIRLQGSFGIGSSVDLALAGVGPVFSADVVFPEKRESLNHRYTVKPGDDGYRVDYAVGMRFAMETSGGNIEYRDLTITGTVLLKRGEKVVIARNGEHELSLTVDLPEKE